MRRVTATLLRESDVFEGNTFTQGINKNLRCAKKARNKVGLLQCLAFLKGLYSEVTNKQSNKDVFTGIEEGKKI